MTDIVERLRKPLGGSPDWRFNGNYLTHRSDEERVEAADEIERLRAENADMKRTLDAPIPWLLERDLRGKIEQQRKALKAVEDWWLSDGMKAFTGAPYAIFATREALHIHESQS